MKGAQLPPQMIESKPRRVREMKPGETGYIIFTELRVNAEQECFLEGDAELREQTFNTIEVRRDAEGFHVVIPADAGYHYRPKPLNQLSWVLDSLTPVASVTIAQAKTG